MRNQSGFTLIELVLVIIILGILAAVAVPRFINLSSEARLAALQGTVGAIESASSINFAARMADPAPAIGVSTAGKLCSAVVPALLQPPLNTTTYSVSGGQIPSTQGDVGACTITINGTNPAVVATASVLAAN